ncbi:hypothetical protein Agub_g10805, partial [Astrephomene gubernaculifera]
VGAGGEHVSGALARVRQRSSLSAAMAANGGEAAAAGGDGPTAAAAGGGGPGGIARRSGEFALTAARALGFLSRPSRSNQQLPIMASPLPSSRAPSLPPAAIADDGSITAAASSGGGGAATGGAASAVSLLGGAGAGGQSMAHSPASPRLFGGLLRSMRAQSFTAAAGLFTRMTGGSGVSVGGGSVRGGRHQPVRGRSASLVEDSTGSGGTTAAVNVTLASNIQRGVPPAADAAGGSATSGAASPFSTPAVVAANTNVAGAGGGGGGSAAASSGGGSGRSPSFLRSLRMSRGASPLAASQPFPFASARRLLPTSWNLGGGGGSLPSASASGGGGGGLGMGLLGGASPGSRLASGAGSTDLSSLAAMVATSLPASRTTQSQISNPALATIDHADMLSGTASGFGAGATAVAGTLSASMGTGGVAVAAAVAAASNGNSGGGGGNVGIAVAASAGAGGVAGGAGVSSGEGPGWIPGEMLADVLHGVQEEEELRVSGRQSTAAAAMAAAGSMA